MEDIKDKIIYVPVEDILPNRFQPRLAFDEKELNELAASIAKYGIIQPIVLRNIGDKYEIIAGERRFKASQRVGLTKVPAIINNTDDNTSAEIALLENLQRKNLTPIEEAQSYRKLIDRGFTQEEIASKLGVSQSSIANKMRLLNLPKRVQDALLYGKISERHARSLLSLNNQDLQLNLLERIIDERLTVKQTEDEISLLLNKSKYNNDIPDEIQKYLSPTSELRFMKQALPVEDNKYEYSREPEIISIPDVVEIIEDPVIEPIKEEKVEEVRVYEKEMESINPFQMNNYSVSDRLPINRVYEDMYSNIVQNDFNIKEEIIEPIEEDKNSLVLKDGSVNIPKVISKVREFVNSLDELKGIISTSEIDHNGKYQIIIEIDKK